MNEMTNHTNITLGGSVKKTLFVVAVTAMLMFAVAGSAFAVNHSGTQRLGAGVITGAPVGGIGSNPANNTAGAGTYTYMDWSTGLGANSADNSPHGNYTTTTVKCAVCHAVHYAAAGGAPVAGGAQTADTLLRMKAGDACSFCHAKTGTAVNGTPVYDGLAPTDTTSGGSQNSGHAVGTNCSECHSSVHGTGADESVASLSGYLLKMQRTGMKAAIDTLDTAAVAQGFAAGAAVGGTAADYAAINTPAMREKAVGIFCAECHNGAYATVAAGAKTNVSTGATAAFTGHRIAAVPTTDWNVTTKVSSGSFTGTAANPVAYAPATDCKSCHDATDSYGAVAFPHSWGGTKMWLTASDSTGGTTEMLPYGTASGSGYSTANGGSSPQLGDGVCLKCHVSSDGASGVGKTF